jgi:hypothetical protein
MKNRMLLGALLAGASVVSAACGYAIDLDDLTAQIRAEYSKRDGVTVNEVFMEMAGGKPAGFINFTVMGIPVTHSCTTTIFDNGQYSWLCQP